MNPAVKERVDAFLADLSRAPVARNVLGVVVSGSAARGEEIWAGDRLVSDIDLMVLTRRTDPRLITGIERVIARHRPAGIDGGQVPLGPLRTHLTFAFYEARANGVVVAGAVEPHGLVPPTDPTDLPVWEGVRVLANRLMEHVKLAVGETSAQRAVAKSYEALAEAYLVAEGRYRPSYTERLAELRIAAPAAAPPEVVTAMTTVLRDRLGAATTVPPPDPATARRHLADGLGYLISRYTGVEDPADEGLARLARRERHWRHRLYWAARLAAAGRWTEVTLGVDPVLPLWRHALHLDAMSTVDQRTLLRDWRACPQVVAMRKGGSA